MKNKLIDKIEELSKEAQSLMGKRERLSSEINQIEIRLHQIAGAITEIDQISKNLEDS